MPLSEGQTSALRLVHCMRHGRLMYAGNVIVSRHQKSLHKLGLIREAPELWIAWELTAQGLRELEDRDERTAAGH